jgi:hypothetical protein
LGKLRVAEISGAFRRTDAPDRSSPTVTQLSDGMQHLRIGVDTKDGRFVFLTG